MTPECRKCGTELNEKNWYPSDRKRNHNSCKECENKRMRLWRKANPDKVRAYSTRNHRNEGHQPFSENKECASYLGVHVAERVLGQVFQNVEIMPYGNPGYDIICNRDKRIDIKSSCQRKDGSWEFTVRHNTTADFFLCLAFDNREDINPLYAWLIPGSKINHLKNASIYPGTIHKWDEYRLDTSKISDCCDTMRTAEAVSA